MEQIMQLQLRAKGSTLVEILADFDKQLTDLVDGRPETTINLEGIGSLFRTPDGREFECTRTYAIVLGQNYGPTAEWAPTPTGLSVLFNGNYSTDTDGTLVRYSWNFGDGTSAEGPLITHDYISAGTFDVTLTVTDNDGVSDSIMKTITVAAENVGPIAEFAQIPTEGNGLEVLFNGGYSTDPDGTVNTYAWNFGDETTGEGMQPVHVYAAAGDYSVTLTVMDNQGAFNSITKLIPVTP